tara:strand:- start:808 stop:921 length:114 start_codon:yes stop_codon:yes gene_type:complete
VGDGADREAVERFVAAKLARKATTARLRRIRFVMTEV